MRSRIKTTLVCFFGMILVLGLMSFTPSSDRVLVADLKCEYKTNPIGIDNASPRFSWKLIQEKQTRGQKQTAFQILVASSLTKLNDNIGDVWDSGKIETDQSLHNTYQGAPLVSAKKYFWKVKVWDASGTETKWSNDATFTMGLLNQNDWKGEWILKEDQSKSDHNWYRKTLTLTDNPSSALVFVASFGYHELYVNGEKITDNVANPASTFMKERISYLTYDIADKLKKGTNVIAVWHAAGWARWRRVPENRNIPFVFKAQAEIVVGSQKISLGTDTTWKCKKSHSEYYGDWDVLDFGGETIDDTKREENWSATSYDDSSWKQAVVYNYEVLNAKIPEGNNLSIALNSKTNKEVRGIYAPIQVQLSAQMVEPQVRYITIKPIAVKNNNDGSYRVDMGENYTGFFEMNLYNGKEGDSILIEISDQTEVVMNWKQKSKYIYGKSGKGTFSNRFNVAGGRWITLKGLTYEPKLEDIKGYVITSNLKRTSKFESSSKLLNQIYETNLNTYLANTMDGILVDCPHRERRGWGEVTVAAMYGDALPNFDSASYLEQYLQFTRDAQLPDGRARAVLNEEDRPFLMWKANNPLTIWETYSTFGDKKVLKDNYESVKKWMDWLYKNSNYETGGTLKVGKQEERTFPGLGDWCTPRGNFWTSSNSPEAVHFNNCLYAFMLDNAQKMATVLEETEDAKAYADRLKVQREATHKLSYNPENGKYVTGQQVDQAFALVSGVTPPSEKKKVYDNLVDNVLYKFPYYDTGSSGQALYTRYFTEYGERMDLVYELLQDKHHPSYGYFLEQGKTVWPERWSAVGNSQIHTCYTGIGGYFIKGFGGIRYNPEKLGMQHIIIKPAVVGDLTFANTEYESLYGNVKVLWTRKDQSATFQIEIPANTTAKVFLPAVHKKNIKEGNTTADKAKGITYVGTEQNDAVGNYVIYNIESGVYNFTVNKLPKVSFPNPIIETKNLAQLGRMNVSSMFIKDEQIPEYEAFKANDAKKETRWLAAQNDNQYLEIEWAKPQRFNQIIIDEFDNQITSYKLQYWDKNKWKDIAKETTCGLNKVHDFKTVTSFKCRVFIEKANQAASISEIKIFKN